MIRKILSLCVVSGACIFPLQQLVGGPLTSAEVTKIINRVSVIDPAKGEHSALIRDVIKDDLGLQTGEKSRSELLFQDNTLTRIGAETFFSFRTGTRDMTLEKGSMLLQVPKGLGGAKIHTAAVTAAITGTTIMMEYFPGRHIKVLVLEGSLRLSRNGIFGDSVVLRPGKMVIMRPDARRIPDPVDVDLAHIVKTSSLVNFPDSPPLPSTALIQAAIDDQAKQMAKNNLVPTNLVMGHGTEVILASNDQLARIVAASRSPAVTVNGGPVAVALGVPATDLGGAAPAITGSLPIIVSISSSTQLLGLLSNVAPAVGGTITISPTAVNLSAPVAVPIGVLPSGANPTSVVTTVTSAPTTLGLGAPAAPGGTTGTLPLGLGHH